ncbi:hypothetical protein RhiirA4_529321 [Rhizophagus irregularis]|uniref:Uncharacterized protein n=1 Tax=Rhizophagus irregularis TaxID=588596 RepID=A0A2I1GU56_9GLOM|nr:hypothetical protein RhiirA4_529321 [Rhizophagus irregularis]
MGGRGFKIYDRRNERVAALNYERIKIENQDIEHKCIGMKKEMDDMKKERDDSVLTSGLMITDMENRIRNLEADVMAKERIILEKNEETNILWGKIKALEDKEKEPTCKAMNNKVQKKKKRPNKKRKRARAQEIKNGMINEIKIGVIGDNEKDRLDKYLAEKSRDITFYDVPAYWSDREIFANLNDNVGLVKYMRSKRCHKYKTVRATLHFSKEYEKIYKEGGVNVSLTRNNRQFFIRMFDSRLTYREVKDKFRWQAIKRLETDIQSDDVQVIKEFVKGYNAFFGKIIRVKGMRFIIVYFNKESQLMSAINESTKKYDIGHGLWIKKQDDFIDDNGDLQEINGRLNNWNKTSRSSGSRMDWEQQSGMCTHAGPSRTNKQWR